MIERVAGMFAAAVVLIATLVAGVAAAAQTRAAIGWIEELDGCLEFLTVGRGDFFETGASEAFPRWHLAYPGGGVCNGPPDPCLGAAVTVISRTANGAATLRERDAEAGGRLTCAHAPNPPHHRHRTHAALTLEWLSRQIRAGRLSRIAGVEGEPSGRFLSCDGEEAPFALDLHLAPDASPAFVFTAGVEAGDCQQVTS